MKHIPENITDFLYWVKEQTESFWSVDPKASGNRAVCEDWVYGAKWKGLTDEQIQQVELKYNIRFTPEHREFLRILHAIDRPKKVTYEHYLDDDGNVLVEEYPFFYNWLENDKEIKDKLKWPFETILDDVKGANAVWLKSWGIKPDAEEEVNKIVSDWYARTPSLLPLTSHRFIVSDLNLVHRPVLSVWGSDIIVYGWNLRSYLLKELAEHLNILELIYDEDDGCYYSELTSEVKSIFAQDFTYDENRHIPFWEEMICYWSSGWSSFGLKFPHSDESMIQPIVKAESLPIPLKKNNEN